MVNFDACIETTDLLVKHMPAERLQEIVAELLSPYLFDYFIGLNISSDDGMSEIALKVCKSCVVDLAPDEGGECTGSIDADYLVKTFMAEIFRNTLSRHDLGRKNDA